MTATTGPPGKEMAPAGTRAIPNNTTTSQQRTGCSHSSRPHAHRQRCTVLHAEFERVGEYYDDVLLTFRQFDQRAVDAIKALPSWARDWDAAAGVWRVHPGYADRLAASLQHLGYTVDGLTDRGAP